MKLTIRSRKKNELDLLMKQVTRSFKFPQSYFRPALEYYPGLTLNDTRMAFIGNQLVASVQIYPIPIYTRGVKLLLGGVANVSTLPDFRHQGIIRNVLNDSMKHMHQSGCQISGLSTGFHDVYRPHQYEIWKRNDVIVAFPKKTPVKTKSKEFHLEEIRMKDLKEIQVLYQTYCMDLTGPLVRSNEYWKAHFHWIKNQPTFFYVMKNREGKILGYIRGKFDKERTHAWVHEAIGPMNNKNYWDFMATEILHILKIGGYNLPFTLNSNFSSHPLRKGLKYAGCQTSIVINKGFMMRIINLKGLLLQFKPFLKSQLSKMSDWNENIQIQSEAGNVTLQFYKGKVRITKSPARKQIILPSYALTEWLLGRRLFSELPKMYKVVQLKYITKKDNEKLDKLFPKTTWNYWYTDSY